MGICLFQLLQTNRDNTFCGGVWIVFIITFVCFLNTVKEQQLVWADTVVRMIVALPNPRFHLELFKILLNSHLTHTDFWCSFALYINLYCPKHYASTTCIRMYLCQINTEQLIWISALRDEAVAVASRTTTAQFLSLISVFCLYQGYGLICASCVSNWHVWQP